MLRFIHLIAILFIIPSCVSSPDTLSKNVIPDSGIIGESVEAMPQDENKYNIGLLVPKEPSKEHIGSSIIKATQIALNENKKAKVNLVVFDSGLITQNPELLTLKLKQSKIKTIIGPVYSKETIDIANLTKDLGITIFSLSNDASIHNDSLLLMGSSAYSQAASLVKFAISQGIEDFYLLLPSNKYGKIIESAVQDLVAEKNGINFNVTCYSLENSEAAITGLVNLISKDAKSLRKKAIFMPQGGNTLTYLNNALTQNKLKIQLIGSQAWDNNDIVNYPYFNGALLINKKSNEDNQFFNNYKEYFGQDATNIDFSAYNAVKLILKMLKNNSNLNKQEITADYPDQFDLNGNLIQNTPIIQIQNKQFKAVE